MAISKLILNNEVQMDVTSNTNTASNMLNGVIGTKNDGTSVTGNIATKTSSDLTTSGATVTAPAGYYSTAATKTVAAGSAFPPAVTITKAPTIGVNTSGVVTASYNGSSSITPTVNAGYISQGTAGTISTTGTSTYQLTSKAAATYYPSTADQTIASQRWLTGNQTIKSVTISNLTAANIAEGVVVKIGDINNASRISQVTGTYAPTTSSLTVTPTETAQTFNATGVYGYKPVTINAISSTYVGTGVSQRSAADITQNSNEITAPMGYYSQSATYTVPAYSHTSPSIGFTSSTGIIKATHTAKDVMQNWGMLTGYITTSSEYALTTQAAQTIYPSTADQTIYRYTWLTGNQTIKSVTTSNLTAENIAEGVVVQVGDSANASSITQITGTHSGKKKYYATITSSGGSTPVYVCYPGSSGTTYFNTNDKFEITEGSIIYLRALGKRAGGNIYINDRLVARDILNSVSYSYTVPSNTDVEISLMYESEGTIRLTEVVSSLDIYENRTYNVSEYDFVDVHVVENGGFTADQIANRAISGSISGFTTDIGNYAFAYCSGLTTASFPNVTTIGSYAFAYCSGLTTASFPNVTTIGNSTFTYCSSLTTVSFPSATTIGNYAFYYCSGLTTVSFPSATLIGNSTFAYCRSLTTVSFPSATSIGSYAFSYCSGLTTVSFPSATTIGNYAFYYCNGLTTASFPNVTTIGSYAFAYCSDLTTASFPNVTTIGSYAFAYCSDLTTASFPNVTTIGSYAFYGCYNLISAIFLASSVASLGVSAFYSTPIAGYTVSTGGVYGSIYVPASLYDSYITATNWAVYSERIVSV